MNKQLRHRDSFKKYLGCAACIEQSFTSKLFGTSSLEAVDLLHHSHDPILVIISVLIAAFASYIALDLASSLNVARGKARLAWILGGSLAMGVGIWSMHFIAMLAFSLPGVQIAYDIFLIVLSVLVAIVASAIALIIVSRTRVTTWTYILGSIVMGAAISGMHYIGIASIRMGARWEWNYFLVGASIVIAVTASFAALLIAFRLRSDFSRRGFLYRALGGIVMGFAISGMHYTAMSAMIFLPAEPVPLQQEHLLATGGLAVAVCGMTILILGIALTGSIVDRALARRQAMADALKESETRFRETFEKVAIGMAHVGTDGSFLRVNPRICEITGYAEQNLLSKTFAEITHPDDIKKDWDLVNDTLAGKIPEYALEKRYIHKSGQVVWVKIRVALNRDEFGNPRYFIVSVDDITDRKALEDTLRSAVSARDEFLSIASHELKTPLTTLKLQSQLRMRNLKKRNLSFFSPDNLEKMILGDQRQIERLSRLIDDMLDISRISTGKLTVQREIMDLCELVSEVIERHRPQFEEAQCPITLEACEKAMGYWDRFRIEQVVANLLMNAVKYGEGKPVSVTVAVTRDHAILKVKDQGIGISQENQERIFQRFERAISASQISGLGLGLYIVKQIVEMHRGSVRVESELGKGSTFIVELPLRATGESPLTSV